MRHEKFPKPIYAVRPFPPRAGERRARDRLRVARIYAAGRCPCPHAPDLLDCLLQMTSPSTSIWPFMQAKRTFAAPFTERKPIPCMTACVPPVSGPIIGDIVSILYGGPTTSVTLQVHISLNHLLHQPPNIISVPLGSSKTIWVSARGDGTSPIVSGRNHLLDPLSRTQIFDV